MAEIIQHTDTVPETCLGKRFDQTLAEMFPEYSRSRIEQTECGWLHGAYSLCAIRLCGFSGDANCRPGRRRRQTDD